jgi:biopolymer transport protein ExbD
MAFSTPNSGAAGGKRRYHSAAMADINMLPMIDVMLVLLIMFMVAAPLLTHAVKVNLPTASTTVMPPDVKPIAISIQADGSIMVNKQPETLDILTPALQALAAQAPANTPVAVQLYADKAVSYGVVAQVMAKISAAGLNQLRFASSPTAP